MERKLNSEDIKFELDWTTSRDRSTTNIALIAEIIRRSVRFARDNGQQLYYYHEGVYKQGAEILVGELYLKWLREADSMGDWRAKKGMDIAEYIGLQSPYLWDRPPLYQINLLNGIYDWELNQFLPHTPDYLSTTQIPITYNPLAKCPAWEKFLHEVLPYEGGVDYLTDVAGICMTPFTGLQKCIVLVGSGANGKSTYLNAIQTAIGKQNISNIPLHTLTSQTDRFSRAGLVGKLVNIFGDMSAKKIEDAANFKPLVGEDSITIEFKHKQPFYYTPFCKLIFSCNEVVKSDDDSIGYKRRFIHIPFTQRFSVDPQKGLDLAAELATPSELSGLLNRILHRLPILVEHGFNPTPEIAAIIDEWTCVPDEIKLWLESTLVANPTGYLPSNAFYAYYVENCPTNETFERGKLITYIKNIFPSTALNKTARLRKTKDTPSKVFRCHQGITTKDPKLLETLVAHSFDESVVTNPTSFQSNG